MVTYRADNEIVTGLPGKSARGACRARSVPLLRAASGALASPEAGSLSRGARLLGLVSQRC